MMINQLTFDSIGPFNNIRLEFDEHVNVFIGPNNCGKSTILMVLGEILVYPFGVPSKYFRKKEPGYEIIIKKDNKIIRDSGTLPVNINNNFQQGKHFTFLEKIGYSTFVPALRQSTDFRAGSPGMKLREKTEVHIIRDAVDPYGMPDMKAQKEQRKRDDLLHTTASLVSDEAIIQKFIHLDYMAYQRKKKSIRKIIENIISIASEITEGFPMEFAGIKEDDNGYYPEVSTPDGNIPLNCLSQGTQSIVQWLARLLIGYAEYYDYPENLPDKPGVLIVDEIDAHLHPSWQIRIIPILTKHFPNLQLFFSTHSPLVVAGLKAGQAHLLIRQGNGVVSVARNDTDIIGWSADEILNCFMNVPNPTDLETSKNIERLHKLRHQKQLSAKEKAELNRLKQKINSSLPGGVAANTIEDLKRLLETKLHK